MDDGNIIEHIALDLIEQFGDVAVHIARELTAISGGGCSTVIGRGGRVLSRPLQYSTGEHQAHACETNG